MSDINKYRIWCNTDSKYVTGWSDVEPNTTTGCFENNTHSIDVLKTSILETRVSTTTKIDEGVGSLGGFYKTKGERMDIPENYMTTGGITSSVSTNDTSINVEQSVIDTVTLDNYLQITNFEP